MHDQHTLLDHHPQDERLDTTASIALSISTLAREFQVSRESVRAWLDAVGAQPVASKNSFPLFALRDALAGFRSSGEIPIDRLPASQRLAAYRAIEVADSISFKRKHLVRAEEHRAEVARILKIVARELEVGGDEIERDCGCPPQVLEAIESKFDSIRHQIYNGVVAPPEASSAPAESNATPSNARD